jgi:hypothetical protein
VKASTPHSVAPARVLIASVFAALAAGSLAYCTNSNDSASNGVSSGGSSAADAGPVSWPQGAADASESDSAALPEGAECATDSDCVPAACCHAAACVPAARRPACEGVMCTMNCQPGTLDCGGSCACNAGRCAANLAQPEVPAVIDAGAPSDAAADASADAGRRRRR